jgi:hypothetical protein
MQYVLSKFTVKGKTNVQSLTSCILIPFHNVKKKNRENIMDNRLLNYKYRVILFKSSGEKLIDG